MARFINLKNSGFTMAEFDIAGDTDAERVNIEGMNIESADMSGCTSLLEVISGSNSSLAAMDVSGCTALERLTVDAGGGISIDGLEDCSALVFLSVGGLSEATLFDLSGNPNLANVTLQGGGEGPTSVSDLTDNPALLSVNFDNCALPEAQIDAILAALDANGLEGGTVILTGGTNAPPSAAGLASKATLEGKSWGVAVNS